ncbi:MAG: hypothetical protein IIB54_16040, partial [Planctomycetes bacterium]|nr:hypothetical protein [Planctomycetota bacterium]
MTPERFKDRIVRHLAKQAYRPRKTQGLARDMGVAEEEYGDFREAVKSLMNSGRIVMGSASALTLPSPPGRVVGQFRCHPRGCGFVIPDPHNSHRDLFVP